MKHHTLLIRIHIEGSMAALATNLTPHATPVLLFLRVDQVTAHVAAAFWREEGLGTVFGANNFLESWLLLRLAIVPHLLLNRLLELNAAAAFYIQRREIVGCELRFLPG
jgi:hypothetical protein